MKRPYTLIERLDHRVILTLISPHRIPRLQKGQERQGFLRYKGYREDRGDQGNRATWEIGEKGILGMPGMPDTSQTGETRTPAKQGTPGRHGVIKREETRETVNTRDNNLLTSAVLV